MAHATCGQWSWNATANATESGCGTPRHVALNMNLQNVIMVRCPILPMARSWHSRPLRVYPTVTLLGTWHSAQTSEIVVQSSASAFPWPLSWSLALAPDPRERRKERPPSCPYLSRFLIYFLYSTSKSVNIIFPLHHLYFLPSKPRWSPKVRKKTLYYPLLLLLLDFYATFFTCFNLSCLVLFVFYQ